MWQDFPPQAILEMTTLDYFSLVSLPFGDIPYCTTLPFSSCHAVTVNAKCVKYSAKDFLFNSGKP